MARVQWKLTAKLGQRHLSEVTQAAGAAETQSETISLNIDTTNMTKGECLVLIEALEQKVHASTWPAA